MENEFDYYIAECLSTLLAWFSDDEVIDKIKKNKEKEVELDIINMSLNYNRKSITLDFFELGVVSEKIFNVLFPIKINGIQLIPVTIFNLDNNKTYNDKFYHLHVYNKLECVDNNSTYYYDYDHGLLNIEKLLLDEEKLSPIPLDERLIFNLYNDNSSFIKQLFHKSIVDRIMTVEPRGIRFVNIKDYKYKGY